ncbi:hypothetical protein [Burkholderia diffusa]|uniref:hypothetical protein n=1 Tax=Burkholderia diffusa TaxID=488732 RepID=UPI001F376A07|nr:hypothetical protein [Burkholderia diffusa]
MFLKIAGNAGEDEILFAQRYNARFNQDVGLYAPFAYDAALAVSAGRRKADAVSTSAGSLRTCRVCRPRT